MKDKFIEVIKGVVVNDKGDTIGKVFCPEFTEKIVDALISAGATVPICGVGMPKQLDKLFELIKGADLKCFECDCQECKYYDKGDECTYYHTAEFLIERGAVGHEAQKDAEIIYRPPFQNEAETHCDSSAGGAAGWDAFCRGS